MIPFVVSLLLLIVAYFTYGKIVEKIFVVVSSNTYSNQKLAMIVSWTIAVYLAVGKKFTWLL